MRYLEWNEVLGLEKFLVEDSDEVIGIEIHKGIPTGSRSSSEPQEIIRYSIEEMAGGELIELDEARTLCAVVGNQLYYKNKYDYVDTIDSGDQFIYYCNTAKRNFDERIVIIYKDSTEKLSDDEILSLKTILVKDNKRVVGVEIVGGCMGVGGSNRSGFRENISQWHQYPLDALSGREPIRVTRSEICALVNDVLYFRCEDEDGKKRVYTLDHRKASLTTAGDSIAYDTVSATRVSLILK